MVKHTFILYSTESYNISNPQIHCLNTVGFTLVINYCCLHNRPEDKHIFFAVESLCG